MSSALTWRCLPPRLSSNAHTRFSFSTCSSHLSSYVQYPTLTDTSGRLLSRVSGPVDSPLNTQTFGGFWNSLVQKYPDRSALIVRHEPSNQHSHHSFQQQKLSSPASSSSSNSSASDACIRWTFAEMDNHVKQLVRGLRKLGVKKGDRVTVLMMNNSAMASLKFAIALVGAITVTLNPSYTAKELLRSMNHIGASYLLIVPSLRSSDYLDKLHTIMPSLKSSSSIQRGDSTDISVEECPTLRRIILVDNLSSRPQGWESQSVLAIEGKGFQYALERMQGKALDYRDILLNQDEGDCHAEEEAGISCHDVCNLQFTSGTTGTPKAVALTSHNLLNNGIMLGKVMHLTPDDVLANIPPLFHCFAYTLGNLAAWTAGSAIVYAAEGFDPVRALRAASEEKATALHGVPAHFIAELDILRKLHAAQKTGQWDQVLSIGVKKDEDWQYRLRTGFTSGSVVPIELMRSIMDKKLLGITEQTVVYGMTETSPVSFACDTQASVKQRCETIGRIVPHAHAKVVSPDDPDGHPLPVGQVGELCTAGYIIMKGYWNDEMKTNEVLQVHPDENDITWMRTGDLAVMDEEGYAMIRGRVKDLIIRGGENLSAVNIENCVDTLPGVASSMAVSVPDEKMGEAVGIFISKHSAQDDTAQSLTPSLVRAHVKEHTSGQSAPDWVWFMGEEGIAKDYPATASGKVQKNILRLWAKDLAEKGQGWAKSTKL